ncbi:MAG: hypothetical protein M1838_000738 [Thelocarpon superellum]|nr:MAG: hypothetical protein M1838_000738 [Thelocarpon superellum]
MKSAFHEELDEAGPSIMPSEIYDALVGGTHAAPPPVPADDADVATGVVDESDECIGKGKQSAGRQPEPAKSPTPASAETRPPPANKQASRSRKNSRTGGAASSKTSMSEGRGTGASKPIIDFLHFFSSAGIVSKSSEKPSVAKPEKPSAAKPEKPSGAKPEKPSAAVFDKASEAVSEKPSGTMSEKTPAEQAETPSDAAVLPDTTANAKAVTEAADVQRPPEVEEANPADEGSSTAIDVAADVRASEHQEDTPEAQGLPEPTDAVPAEEAQPPVDGLLWPCGCAAPAGEPGAVSTDRPKSEAPGMPPPISCRDLLAGADQVAEAIEAATEATEAMKAAEAEPLLSTDDVLLACTDAMPVVSPPRASRRHRFIRKTRNIFMTQPLLTMLLGRELAHPAKSALKTLANGERLAPAGDEIEFVTLAT